MIETTRDLASPDARSALTPRGRAAARLSEFQDEWATLTREDREWFAHWLTELLVDACLEAPTR